MDLKRAWRHAVTDVRSARRAFSPDILQRLETLVREGEQRHGGELRFVVESTLSGRDLRADRTPRDRALDVFSLLRVWDTDDRNGVLVYVLMADRAVEIIADRGIHARVGETGWRTLCAAMEAAFREGRFRDGALDGVRAINDLLASHFPAQGARRNELPDAPVILG